MTQLTDQPSTPAAVVARVPRGVDPTTAWRQPRDRRTRTVTWESPDATVAAAATASGLDVMQRMAAGELPPPPVALVLGFGPSEIAEGRCVFATEPGEHQYNPLGTVHGGVIATLLDSAMGCAVQTTLPAATGYTTTDLQVRYVRPVTDRSGRLECEGTVVHRGARLATAEGRLTDAHGRLLAHATTSCLILAAAG